MLQERLLDVAIDHFCHYGFEGAATRKIAAEAGTAMSSITYHFGGKEGLYLACAEHIGRQIASRQVLVFEGMGEPAGLGRDDAIAAFLGILNRFVAMMVHPESASWAGFIAREQQEPTEAFERLWHTAMGPVLETGGQLLAQIAPHLTDRQRNARLVLIFGQVLVLRQARASVCKTLGVAELGEAERLLLQEQISATTRAILNSGE